MDIQRHKTAIARPKVSVPTKWAFNQGVVDSTSNVFDWGCGKGKDSEWLKEQGCNVTSYDPFYAPENNPKSFDFSNTDVIICNYVLNVIECPQERIDLVQNIIKSANGNAKIVISARPDKQINKEAKKKGWKSYSDGFVTSHNTFQKGYNLEELTNFVGSLSDQKLSNSHKSSGGVVCVY
jgi:DNA phosphorothioation-associated putative methyltransferase